MHWHEIQNQELTVCPSCWTFCSTIPV